MIKTLQYQDYSIYFWFCMCGVFLAIEVIGANGYLLCSAVAAIITGFIVWLFSIDWQWQGFLFSFMAIIVLWLFNKWFKSVKKTFPEPFVNKRSQQFIGRKFIVENSLVNCSGSVRVNDSIWPIRANNNIVSGVEVEVFKVDGITLIIRETI